MFSPRLLPLEPRTRVLRTEVAIANMASMNEIGSGNMIAKLIIPQADGVAQEYQLKVETHDGQTVLFSSHGHVVTGEYIRFLRDRMDARIVTTDEGFVRKILHLNDAEAGVTALK